MEHDTCHSTATCRKSQFVHANNNAISRCVSWEIATESKLIFIYVCIFTKIIFSYLRRACLPSNTKKRSTCFTSQSLTNHMLQNYLHFLNIGLAGYLRINYLYLTCLQRKFHHLTIISYCIIES